MHRDAEVLSLFAAIITKLRELMAPEVPRVFEAIFECTLQMITKNFAVGLAYSPVLLPCQDMMGSILLKHVASAAAEVIAEPTRHTFQS